MRPIDADALIPMMKYATTDSEIGVFPIKIGFNDIEKVINEQPTIEPQRTGKWELSSIMHSTPPTYMMRCSECGMKTFGVHDFCPNCGADMREPEDIPMEYFESGGR